MDTSLAAPPRARVLGASVPGPGHVRRGEAGQDAHATTVAEDGAVVVAVADGMGSAAAGADGARAAVEAAVGAVVAYRVAASEATLPHIVEHAMACARLAVVRAAGGRPIRDLACTLMIAVLTADEQACAAHIGDGAVLIDDGTLSVLSPPGESEYLEVTDPITAPDWRARLRCSPVATAVRAIAAFTDGVQHAALAPDGSPGAGFLRPLLDFARDAADEEHGSNALASLLAGPKLSEHSDDDKTLVLAVLP